MSDGLVLSHGEDVPATRWRLNPGARFFPFDSARAGEHLVELDDPSGRTQRTVVSRPLFLGLQALSQPMSMAELRAQFTAEEWESETLSALVTALEGECLKRRLIVPEEIGESHAVSQQARPHYMTAMIQLLSPRAVNPLARVLSPLFSRWGFVAGLVFALIGAFLLVRGARTHVILSVPSPEDILLGFFLGALIVGLHELGHAAAAWRGGARKVSIGVGWYVLFPVAYANLSEIWRFPARQRVVVNLAGVYFQAIALLPLMVAYELTGHGALIAVGSATAVSIAWNLNPLIRLDGYWVLSDLLKTSDLRGEALGALKSQWRRMRNLNHGSRAEVGAARPFVSALLAIYAVVCTALFAIAIFAATSSLWKAAVDLSNRNGSFWSDSAWSSGSFAALVVISCTFLWKLTMIWFTARFLGDALGRAFRWSTEQLRAIGVSLKHGARF